MASKELRIHATGDSSTSSDSSSEDDDNEHTSMDEDKQDISMEEEEEQQDLSGEEISPKSVPPKMRIKLSLRMPKSPKENPKVAATASTTNKKDDNLMPMKQSASTSEKTTPSTSKKVYAQSNTKTGSEIGDAQDTTPPSSKNDDETENDDEAVVQAIVVDTEEEGTSVDVVAKVVEPAKPDPAKSSKALKKRKASSKPSLPTINARTVRLPPLASPGMLLPPSAGVYRGDADSSGYTTPASVFDHCMSLAGYTTKARTEHPHRGSSVRRQVGDMFDSDVSFAVNFPPLVPKELWSLPKKKDQDKKDDAPPETNGQEPNVQNETKDEEPQRDAALLLLRSLAPSTKEHKEQNQADTDSSSFSRKRRRPWQFSEMAPLSLTLPYPESYIQKRLRYAEKVKERERAIVVNQEAKQNYEDAQDRYSMLLASAKRNTEVELTPPPVRPEVIPIPPIPEPVSPPRISEMEGEEIKGIDESRHPIYLPQTHEKFTSHLDPACFDITNGRYFGAFTNSIADPNFVGPNAPGITGLNLAGGSGLATAYTGSTSGGSAAFLTSTSAGSGAASGSTKSSKKKAANTAVAPPKPVAPVETSGAQDDATGGGPTPTSTSTALKRIMDENNDDALQMKTAIVRAAVYAARVGMHGMSFVGSNGEVYPDVSKAFAAHGGVRPCSKCKNNKQGAYHCRLRRKHKAMDYDGGDSPGALAPLFQEPLEDLLLSI